MVVVCVCVWGGGTRGDMYSLQIIYIIGDKFVSEVGLCE